MSELAQKSGKLRKKVLQQRHTEIEDDDAAPDQTPVPTDTDELETEQPESETPLK